MRVLKILPGMGGGFFPESSQQDQALVAELRWAGHDVLMVPLFFPIPGAIMGSFPEVPLFYGALRIHLEQRFPSLRRLPGRLHNWLDSAAMQGHARHVIRRTPAAVRGALLLSLLRAENGGQAKDLEALSSWLVEQTRPDIVHISSAFLSGLARHLGKVLKVPVICSLQEEEAWVDALPLPVAKRVWAELRSRVPDISCFIASSHYAAERMPRHMGMPARNLRVIHPGIESPATGMPGTGMKDAMVWGVVLDDDDHDGLVRVCSVCMTVLQMTGGTGLHLRIAGPRPDAKLRSAIGPQIASGEIQFVPAPAGDSFEQSFLPGLTFLSWLPRKEPAFAIELLQAMSGGVVVVQPDAGSSVEILDLAEGGLLYEHESAENLTDTLVALVRDPERCRELSKRGQRGVALQFSPARMARETVEVYESVREKRRLSIAR